MQQLFTRSVLVVYFYDLCYFSWLFGKHFGIQTLLIPGKCCSPFLVWLLGVNPARVKIKVLGLLNLDGWSWSSAGSNNLGGVSVIVLGLLPSSGLSLLLCSVIIESYGRPLSIDILHVVIEMIFINCEFRFLFVLLLYFFGNIKNVSD